MTLLFPLLVDGTTVETRVMTLMKHTGDNNSVETQVMTLLRHPGDDTPVYTPG